jgi:acyl carrier protein
MDTEYVYDKLTDIFQRCFDNDDLIATPSLTAADVAGWDSLAHVRLMLAVERTFKVKFSATEMSTFENVGALATAILVKSGGAASR